MIKLLTSCWPKSRKAAAPVLTPQERAKLDKAERRIMDIAKDRSLFYEVRQKKLLAVYNRWSQDKTLSETVKNDGEARLKATLQIIARNAHLGHDLDLTSVIGGEPGAAIITARKIDQGFASETALFIQGIEGLDYGTDPQKSSVDSGGIEHWQMERDQLQHDSNFLVPGKDVKGKGKAIDSLSAYQQSGHLDVPFNPHPEGFNPGWASTSFSWKGKEFTSSGRSITSNSSSTLSSNEAGPSERMVTGSNFSP